jgi:serine phosphatase RsbU (regulator of sigma subunit)
MATLISSLKICTPEIYTREYVLLKYVLPAVSQFSLLIERRAGVLGRVEREREREREGEREKQKREKEREKERERERERESEREIEREGEERYI